MRLQLKVTLWVVAILVAFGVVALPLTLYLQHRTIEHQFEHMASAVAEVVRDGLQHDMLAANREHVRQAVVDIQQQKGINEVTVIGADMRVFASGDPSENGTLRNDEKFATVLRTGQPLARAEERFGREEYCVIYPVFNQPQCQGCHGSQEPILGIIEVGLTSAAMAESTRNLALIMGGSGAFALLGVGGVLTFVLRRQVLSPISRLARSAQGIAQGDYSSRTDVDGSDEVGLLARSFNQMAERVERDTQELEERVRQRTRELSVLNELASTLSQFVQLDQVLGEALGKVMPLLEADAGTVHLGKDKQTLVLRAHYGLSEAEARRSQRLRQGATDGSGRLEGFGAGVDVPIRSKGETLGLLSLFRRNPNPFPPETVRLLGAMGDQIGIAVENAQLYEAVQRREADRGELLRKVMSAQEEERRRIARELHDQVGQILSTAALSLTRAEESLPARMSQVKARLQEAHSLTTGALTDMRKLILDLRPEVLDDLGLVPAVRWYLNHLDDGIEVRMEAQGLEERLPPQIEVALFRAIQEAVNNVVRHAQATQLAVSLAAKEGFITVLVQDNGRGFDVEQVMGARAEMTGWGLRGMRERVGLVEGTLDIHSQRGKGTSLLIRIPFQRGAYSGQDTGLPG